MSAPPNWRPPLEFIWGQYRIWSATSRAYQSQLSSWRKLVLYFGIAGAIVGTLSGQVGLLDLSPDAKKWLTVLLAFVSAVLLALATYFTTKILTPANEGAWLRARAAAESFKREAYLLLAQAPPYDGPITPASLARLKRIISEDVHDLEEEHVTPDGQRKGMPTALLSADDYIRDRVQHQIKWYRRRAAEHKASAGRIKGLSLALGAVAVVLGLLGPHLSSLLNDEQAARWVGVPAAFIAVFTTITTSLASYLYAGRYQYLVVSYLATARKLEERVLEWELSGKTDDERKQFVQDCEGLFAAENSGWMAELSRRDRGQGPPAPEGATPPANAPGNGGGGGEGVVKGGEVKTAGEGVRNP
ncbi:MAG TPA: DUF4231 domain-containing protein [Pyrinomonadaceae bacterium]|nr:DUF4231 domain-containing protein [Pyrinomonadaceae bacterium]